MVYLHPIVGVLFLVLVVFLGYQGLRGRHRAAYAPRARKLHGRLSWWVYGLCVAALLAGSLSSFFLRDDMDPGQTWHFPVAVGVTSLMTVCALLTLWMRRRRWVATLHWLVGLLLMAAAVAVGALGMNLLP